MKWVFLAGWVALLALFTVLQRGGHWVCAPFVLGSSTIPLRWATLRAIRDTGYNPADHPPPPDAEPEGGGLNDPVTKETWIALGAIAAGLVICAALGAAGALPSDAPGTFMIGVVILMLACHQLILLGYFAIACRQPRRSDP